MRVPLQAAAFIDYSGTFEDCLKHYLQNKKKFSYSFENNAETYKEDLLCFTGFPFDFFIEILKGLQKNVRRNYFLKIAYFLELIGYSVSELNSLRLDIYYVGKFYCLELISLQEALNLFDYKKENTLLNSFLGETKNPKKLKVSWSEFKKEYIHFILKYYRPGHSDLVLKDNYGDVDVTGADQQKRASMIKIRKKSWNRPKN